MAKTLNYRNIFSQVFIPFVGMMVILFTITHAQASPTLSYFTKDEAACSWYYWDVALPKERKLLVKLPVCPELVFFDSQQNIFYFTSGDAVYSLPLQPLATKPQLFARLPNVNGSKRVLWNDKSKGKLRLLVVNDVAEKDVVHKDGKTYLRNEEGMLIEGNNDEMFIAGFSYAVMWKNPQLVTVFELISDDKWQRKAELATESFFGLAGAEQNWKEGAKHWYGNKYDPAASIWNERGTSDYSALSDLCDNETEWHCLGAISDFLTPTIEASVVNYFGKTQERSLFYVAFNKIRTSIVFGSVFGHKYHAVLPILFCKNKCRQQSPLDISTRSGNTQVRLSVVFPYLLVVDDDITNGNNPNIIDLRTGKTIYKSSGFGAMWMFK